MQTETLETLTVADWLAALETATTKTTEGAFAVGDWLLYGEEHFSGQMLFDFLGDKEIPSARLSQKLQEKAAEKTGMPLRELKKIVRVCRAVSKSVRNNKLPFLHHEAVAGLDPSAQSDWLGLVAENADGICSVLRLKKSLKIWEKTNERRIYTAEEIIDFEGDTPAKKTRVDCPEVFLRQFVRAMKEQDFDTWGDAEKAAIWAVWGDAEIEMERMK